MGISTYDIQNIDNIMAGMGDWFTSKLLRLMRDSDMDNLMRLAEAFPDEFVVFARWKWNALPEMFDINSIHWANEALDKPLDIIMPIKITHGRDF